MIKKALLSLFLLFFLTSSAWAQLSATREEQYIAVLKAVVNYKINDVEYIRNIERLREDQRFNAKLQKMLDKLSNNRSKNTTNRKVMDILEQAGKDLYRLLD